MRGSSGPISHSLDHDSAIVTHSDSVSHAAAPERVPASMPATAPRAAASASTCRTNAASTRIWLRRRAPEPVPVAKRRPEERRTRTGPSSPDISHAYTRPELRSETNTSLSASRGSMYLTSSTQGWYGVGVRVRVRSYVHASACAHARARGSARGAL